MTVGEAARRSPGRCRGRRRPRPTSVSSIESAGRTTCSRVGRRTSDATTTSVGQHDLDAALCGLGEVAAHGVELVLLEQAGPDLVALGREEGEEHAAADEQRVDPRQQVVDDAELVGDLRAAEDDRVRAARGSVSRSSTSSSAAIRRPAALRQQPAPRRRRWPACGARHRSRRRRSASPSAASLSGERRRARRRPCEVSPALKRRFSSSATSPSARSADGCRGRAARRCRSRTSPAARAARTAAAPPARGCTSHPARRRGARGGRSRRRGAPAWISAFSVGREARMRPSSVMRRPSSGTLRSQRTRTRLPGERPERVNRA